MYIVIGAGHSLQNGENGKLNESKCTREIASAIYDNLTCEKKYIYEDGDNDINSRAEKANIEACDLYVEIHMSSSGTNGIRIISNSSLDNIANDIINYFGSNFYIPSRGYLVSNSLALFKQINHKTLIIECCSVDDVEHYNPVEFGKAIAKILDNSSINSEEIISTTWKNGWNKDSKGWFYVTDINSKSYYKDCWKYIDNYWYYFKSSGYACCNEWFNDNSWYYFDKDCHMVDDNWLLTLKDSNWYYLSSSGKMIANDWFKYNNHWYFLKENGVLAIKQWIKHADNWYYLDENGKMLSKTLFESNNKTYYLDESGKMVTNCTIEINNEKYTFNEKGELQ